MVGVATAFPVAAVVFVIRKLNFGYPFYPLIASLALGDELERIAPFRRHGNLVHFVGHDDVIAHDVVYRKGGGVLIIGVEDDLLGLRQYSSVVQYIPHQHAVPQDVDAPPLYAVQPHHFLVMLVGVKHLLVGEAQRLLSHNCVGNFLILSLLALINP